MKAQTQRHDANGAMVVRQIDTLYHKYYDYGFTADLTPIALEIEGKQVTAFDGLYFYPDGRIIANHEGKWYGSNFDLTPIALEIEGKQVLVFDGPRCVLKSERGAYWC